MSVYKCCVLWLLLYGLVPGAVGNRPPRFLIDGLSEVVVRLKEGADTPAGSLIYRLKGVDPDDDELTFGIRDLQGSNLLRLEAISPNEANIYLNKELDREVSDEYSFVLTLTDGHLGEGNFITQSFLLLVEDVNDNEPVFKPYPTSIIVKENSSPGLLTTVEATDLDEGAYGQVVYHLQELDGEINSFSIQTINGKGVIKLTKSLDYERKSLYQLRILAVDRANQGQINTGTAAILVKVEDVEDQPPEFIGVVPVKRLGEDSPIGTSVLQVKAVDGDRGVNNKISYAILSGGEDVFAIDSNSGVVYTTDELDREDPNNENGAYILEIKATENSKEVFPPPSVTTEVTVLITDVNDETPTFRSDKYICEVSESAQQNMPVTFLTDAIPEVFDHDQGKNGTFELFLDGDNGIFDVTPYRGVNEASFLIRVAQPTLLDYENVTIMHFNIIAQEIVNDSPKMSSVPVTVHIKDENDNFPVFTESVYHVFIPENSPAGTSVAWVQAYDVDSENFGTKGIRYTNITGDIEPLLNLDSESGIITTASEGGEYFDREVIPRHYLTIEARDNLGRGRRSTTQLIIDLEDVNDNAPVFSASKYEAKILENENDFEQPLIVEAKDVDLKGSKNSQILYRILENEMSEKFTIDPQLGLIKPKQPIDFESIPGGKTSVRQIRLNIRGSDLGTPQLFTDIPVIIYVQDINDHVPIFEKVIYQSAIPEDLVGGTKIIEVKASDNDGSQPNNVIVYRLQKGGKDKFSIDPTTGVISVAPGANLDPDLTVPKTVHYTLTVLAIDGGIGEEQLSAAVLVNITILDVNNKTPTFQDPGVIFIKENTQVGKLIHRIEAHDPDEDAVLRYSIAREVSRAKNEDGKFVKLSTFDYLSVFDLDQVYGGLKVSRLLDREKVEEIKLVIMVEDIAALKNGPRQTATATLTILVDDENDNDPKFKKDFYKLAVPENSKNGVHITDFIAEDADKNKTIHYYLEGAEDILKLVNLDSENGELMVASKIDHEIYSWMNMSIKAVDSGIPPRSSIAEVFLQVLDENDNNPMFDAIDSNIRVSESVQPGTVFAFITAKDFDSGEYGKITYILDGLSSQGMFSIDRESGALAVARELDRETQSSHNLLIEAWDNYQYGFHTGESRNAFKQITITVEDANDNSPVLVEIEDCIWSSELTNVGTQIGVIHATDKDDASTPNGRVRIEIVDSVERDLFRLEQAGGDSNTARIIVSSSLRDRYGNYTLVLEATDLGIPKNRVRGEVAICVSDYNDHAPVFVGHQNNQTIKVPENSTVDSILFRVRAIDSDVGANGAVRYRLRDNSNTFAVHPLTGDVTLKRHLDREKRNIYQIRLEAYDLGTPTSLSSELELWVYVKNVRSYKPRFIENFFKIKFTENMQPGEESATIPAVEELDEITLRDEPHIDVCYYLLPTDVPFKLDSKTRRISAIKSLDREQQPIYNLTVLAVECDTNDIGGITAYGGDNTLNLVVHILDVNDNPPRFVNKLFTGGITTDADFGLQFMYIKAQDPDEGENAIITYFLDGEVQRTLSEGLDNLQVSPFTVHPKTGAVALNFDPQRGMKGYFDFKVIAEDSGGLSDNAHVFIYLLREDQRVKFILRHHPTEIRDKVRQFRQHLSTVTGAIVNVDDLKVHENKDGSVDHTKTDLYMHLVNGNDHSVLEVDQVLGLIDKNVEQLDYLFKEFNVLDTQAAEWSSKHEGINSQIGIISGLSAAALGFGGLALLLFTICMMQRVSYIRRLRAATAHPYSTGESELTLRSSPNRVPNTNKHTSQGSNPIWLQAYENDWYKQDEQLSQSERDSLDDNNVIENNVPNIDNEKPYFVPDNNYFPSLESTGSDTLAQRAKYDFYQHLEQMNNAKNLETTEL